MSLFQEAMADVGISVEEFQTIPADGQISDPILEAVSVDQPSVSIPVSDEVAATVQEITTAAVPVEEIITPEEPVIETAIAEHAVLQEKADTLIGLQTAMERYQGIIRKAGFNGITPQTAEVLQVHMQIANQLLGNTTQIGSMEAFVAKDPRAQHELATVSMEDIKATSKAALTKFMEIVNRIIEFIKRAGQNFFDGVTQVERAIDQLDAQLTKIKVPGGEGTVNVAATILMNGDTLDREVSPDIHGLAHFASYTYPEEIVKFLNGITKGVLKFDAEGAGMDELDAFFAQYSKPLQFLIDQEANKDPLPGGYTLDVSEHGLSIGVSYHDSRKPAMGNTQDVPVLTTVELRKLVRDLKALVVQLKEIRPEAEKISQSGKKLVEAVKRAMTKADEGTDDIYDAMALKVGKIVQESSPRAGEIIDYLIRYAKAHCVVISQQIKVIESGTKA